MCTAQPVLRHNDEDKVPFQTATGRTSTNPELQNIPSDIHRDAAAKALGIKPEDVTDEQRRAAKIVSYGLMYGGEKKL
jgi:DNA polymerase I-like protein with 3'-5' exonuclease and polymerase domains